MKRRPPHIHAKVWVHGRQQLTTHIYLQGQGGPQDLAMSLVNPVDSAFAADLDFVIKAA